MYLLTASGTFTASQYESIVESTKQAIDGLLNVFSALMPVYAILGAAMFGIAFVLLLIHIIEGGCDMERVTEPLSYANYVSHVTRPYYNPNTGACEPAPPGRDSFFESKHSAYARRRRKEVKDWYDSHDMFGREKF